MPLTAHFFEGKSPDVALVIAGVHGSEVSGIEVAQWILVKLYRRINADREKGRPHYTTIIIPELFPDQAGEAGISQYHKGASASCCHKRVGEPRYLQATT